MVTMGDKIAFKLGERTFGVDIDAVYKILEVDRVFFIPGQSGFINGVVSLMGEPIAVVSCRKALDAPEGVVNEMTHKIIIVRDKNKMVGLDINGAVLSFIWKEKIKGTHTYLGSPEELSQGTHRFTSGMIDVEESNPVEIIDWTAVFEETKKILSEQQEHGN